MDNGQVINSADHDLLIEVNTNVKNLTRTLEAYTSSANKISNDHETRIRVLETANSKLEGAQRTTRNLLTIISVIGGVVTVVLSIVSFARG